MALFPVCDAFAIELIQNGSFEIGAPPLGGGPLLLGWDDGPGVENDLGFGSNFHVFFSDGEVQLNDGALELPPGAIDGNFTGFISPVGAGEIYGNLWGLANGDGIEGSATQIVDLTNYAGVPFEFSAWIASRLSTPPLNDTDFAVVSLEFFSERSATGDSLSVIEFNGNDQNSPFIAGSLNLQGFADPTIPATQDNWTLYAASGIIPFSAQSAAVVIRNARGDHGFVDLVSLQVVPEPATAVLLGMLIAVLGVQTRAKVSRRVRESPS